MSRREGRRRLLKRDRRHHHREPQKKHRWRTVAIKRFPKPHTFGKNIFFNFLQALRRVSPKELTVIETAQLAGKLWRQMTAKQKAFYKSPKPTVNLSKMANSKFAKHPAEEGHKK